MYTEIIYIIMYLHTYIRMYVQQFTRIVKVLNFKT